MHNEDEYSPIRVPFAPAADQRKIGIAVDLSDESAFAVQWAVLHYLRHGDSVILLHVRPTSVLYGADWGSVDMSIAGTENEESQKKLESDFDTFTSTKASDLAQPLIEAHIPLKIHIVKDHDMKERLCLEVERLGLSAVIMGSRGVGAARRGNDGRLGSVSDYCVRHCVCPVVVVRYPGEKEAGEAVVQVAEPSAGDEDEPSAGEEVVQVAEPSAGEEEDDASDERKSKVIKVAHASAGEEDDEDLDASDDRKVNKVAHASAGEEDGEDLDASDDRKAT